MYFNSLKSPRLAELIRSGKSGILPTDTIYGLVASAFDKKAVEKLYKVKGRDLKKPFIVLISSYKDLEKFGVEIDRKTNLILQKFWPGKVSIILPVIQERFFYLHRGAKSLAFRLPDYPMLTTLIKKTGPIVAPSANPEGLSHAKTVKEARGYFKDSLDFYVDVGVLESKPSTLVQLKKSGVKILRQGELNV